MATLLKIMGSLWFAVGLWVLWRNITGLSLVTEAVQPVGSRLVSGYVLSAILVFIIPGLAAVVLGVVFSSKRISS